MWVIAKLSMSLGEGGVICFRVYNYSGGWNECL